MTLASGAARTTERHDIRGIYDIGTGEIAHLGPGAITCWLPCAVP
jgi:hypothetical protein